MLHVLNGAAGGAFLSTLTLIRALQHEGIESSAVCHALGSAEARDQLRDATSGRIVFRPLYWWNKKVRAKRWKRPAIEALQLARTGALVASTASVARAVRDFNAELIHTNSIVITEGARAARLLGAPHVWHLREMVGKGEPFRFSREGRRLGRYLSRRASVVVATSRNAAARLGDLDQLVVVYNGIDLPEFSRKRGQSESVVVAMVGNVSAEWKRHDLFIESASGLPASVEIRIYGDPPGLQHPSPYAQRMVDLARSRGLADRLKWMGHRPPVEIMRDIDILVHPASGESFGRTVVEAMAAGVPVVGVRAGGVAELIDHGATGYLVEPDSASELRTAVLTLIGDADLRARMGAAGRARVDTHFSVAAYSRGMLEVYERAMTHPVPRGLPS